MKTFKLFSVLLFVFLLTGSTNAQSNWVPLNSGTATHLRGVYFLDESTGYAIGGTPGTILKTTDGGLNWIEKNCPISEQVANIYFTDYETGYAVGGNEGPGYMLKTIDGGKNWTTQTYGSYNRLYGLSFPTANVGYAAGVCGTILKTENGGDSWFSLNAETGTWFQSIFFTDANTGYVAGQNGTILKTTDGGIHWNPQNSGTAEWITSIHFVDSNTGYAVAKNGTIIKTIDGSNWFALVSGTTCHLNDIYFNDSNTGYVVGDNATIIKIINSGANWSIFNSGATNHLSSVYFPNSNTGFAVGNDGTILKITTDGLVAYYPFNGNANDESGNGRDGVVQGASLTTDRFGKSNSAYDFNGSNNMVNCGHGNSLQLNNAITISAWFNSATSDVLGRYIIGKCDRNTPSYEYLICFDFSEGVSGYGLKSCIGGLNPDELGTNFQPTANTWYHVAVTWEYPGFFKLYLNGALINSKPSTSLIEPTDQDAIIGCIRPSGEPQMRYFSGKLDDIKIYNRALFDSEIQQLYYETSTPVELTSFSAEAENGLVTLNWTTQSETENYGFLVYRSLIKDGEYDRITNALIPGAGSVDQAHTYSYIDNNVASGITYYYKLADLDFAGNMAFYGPISVTVNELPVEYTISQNYPNPFNPTTAIDFSLKESGKVLVNIFNLQGRLVRTLVDEEKLAGTHTVMWDGTDPHGVKLTTGAYLYTLKVNEFEQSKKLLLVK